MRGPQDGVRRVVGAVVALSLFLVTGAVAMADTTEEIARAEAELASLQERADELAVLIEQGWERQFRLETEIARLTDAQALIEAEFVVALTDLQETAVRLYMDVTAGEGFSAVLATSDEVYATAIHYLSTAAHDSEEALRRLTAIAAELERRRDELTAALDARTAVDEALVVLAGEVTEALGAQSARLEELEALRARELFLATSTTTTVATTTTTEATTPEDAATTTTASSTTQPTTTTTEATTTTTVPTTTTTTVATTTTTAPESPPPPPAAGGGACPVAGPVTYVDSWGAPRSGGRAHEGVDMISARGTPIAAIYSGVIKRATSSSLGGITIWLRSDAGDEYYYAHLDGYAPGIATGVRVSEGEIIGYNGSTGNAPDYLPHLHFEYHPGGGGAVNPYPLVKSICG
ncbi:MAG TPA: peptidoglycan DD-metalloendopeptidase family protein [Acidimicrobiia bacterium]|nr:peptidoglycan DD-metalloendopeptidase family protein [Acidimicrobiia bacterium]